jgi:hypothetical protein
MFVGDGGVEAKPHTPYSLGVGVLPFLYLSLVRAIHHSDGCSSPLPDSTGLEVVVGFGHSFVRTRHAL